MAGPYYYDPENGNDANDGLSELTPRKLIPGQAGAIAVSAGASRANPTIINIRNGTTTDLRVLAPGNNFLYRGYGLADNVLIMTLPKLSNPMELEQVRVVREPGAHEGMWTIANAIETAAGFNYLSRNGITVEDLRIDYPSATQPISIGVSAIGVADHFPTLRRSEIVSSADSGLNGYMLGWTIEFVRIGTVPNDAISIVAHSNNGYRAGYTDTLYGIEIIDPGSSEVLATGDAFQTSPASNGYFRSGLNIKRVYVHKSSNSKQAMQLNDATAGFNIECFHFECPDSHGTAQIAIANLQGSLTIENGYQRNGSPGNPTIRQQGDQGVVSAAGGTLTVRNVISEGDNLSGFYALGGAVSPATFDGTTVIENCHAKGASNNVLSWAGGISMNPGPYVTIGAGASVTVRNNVVLITGVDAVVLPAGKAGDALYPVENNAFRTDATFKIGSTVYANKAAFESAHNKATNNIVAADAAAFGILSTGGFTKASPLLKAGKYSGLRRDIHGRQRPNPPSIGAYDVATLRRVLVTDPAAFT